MSGPQSAALPFFMMSFGPRFIPPQAVLSIPPEPTERKFPAELTRMLTSREDTPIRLSKTDLPATASRLGSNPEVERRAMAKLKLANTLRSEGLEEEANRYVKELLAQYPNTTAADEAASPGGLARPASSTPDTPKRLSRPTETNGSKQK